MRFFKYFVNRRSLLLLHFGNRSVWSRRLSKSLVIHNKTPRTRNRFWSFQIFYLVRGYISTLQETKIDNMKHRPSSCWKRPSECAPSFIDAGNFLGNLTDFCDSVLRGADRYEKKKKSAPFYLQKHSNTHFRRARRSECRGGGKLAHKADKAIVLL